MIRSVIVAAIFAVTALAMSSPSAAQWTTSQKAEFYSDCIDACAKNPKVPDPYKPQCRDYCNCVIEDGQKILSEADYDEATSDFAAGRNTPKVKAFQGLTPVCNRRAFAPR